MVHRFDGLVTMLDVEVGHDFQVTGQVYFTWIRGSLGKFGLELAVGRLTRDGIENTKVIFKSIPKIELRGRYGGRIMIADERVYVTVGDQLRPNAAQDLTVRQGKIFWQPGPDSMSSSTARDFEIFTYGHRNVQGLAQDPTTRIIWAIEHGPKGDDELNELRLGANYGWPLSRDMSESDPTITGPFARWSPAIAPSSLVIHDGRHFPEWQGQFFVGTLVRQQVLKLTLGPEGIVEQEALLCEPGTRIRDIAIGHDGAIYAIEDASRAKLIRIEPR